MRLVGRLLNKKDRENIEIIKNSDLFDEKYYLKENNDIGMDAAKHYYYYGYKEGKSPSYDFSNDYYLDNYKDVKDAGINPLIHYLKYGKKENRLIKKDNGLSICDLYYKIYNYNYKFNIHIVNENIKRINLFFEKIDNHIKDYLDLFNYLFEFCNIYDYRIRIIYRNADLECLNDLFKNNNMAIPKKIEYLYLKNNNYLFVSKCEKFICTSYKCANALLNSKNLQTNIYFYVQNVGSNIEEKYYISKLCFNKNVKCLVSNQEVMKQINKIDLNFKFTDNLKLNAGLYYKYNSLFFRGIEFLNMLYLDGTLDYKKNDLSIVNNDIKFHLDSDVRVYNCDAEVDGEVIFSLCDQDEASLFATIKIQRDYVVNYIDILHDNLDIFYKTDKYIKCYDSEYIEFKKCILKAKSGEENV